MKKLYLFCALVLTFTELLAQSNTVALKTPSMTSQLPPAPNAYELTRYAGMPVNLSTGAVTQTIALGEITQGKLRVPISLSYNGGNGLKVDQMASRAGVNWTLNAGGVVSRTVANKPDETSTWRPYPAISAGGEAMYTYLDEVGATTGMYDSEPDIFSFNFNGYSGQFILDQLNKTGEVIHLVASPLKVETNFGNAVWNIRITTPDGTQYDFGGSEATEESKTVQEGAGCGRNYDNYIPTAWYLKKIKHYAGDEINFQYYPVTFDYYSGLSQTFIRTPQTTLNDTYNYGTPCPDRASDQTCGSLLRSKGVVLYRISSNLYSATLFHTSRQDSAGDVICLGVQFDRSDMRGPTESKLIKSWTFNYTYSSNNKQLATGVSSSYLTSRPFLTSVTGNENYLMRYYNINDLPARLSFSQDYWGYYNDKNNLNLIPRSTVLTDVPIFPGNMANREPDGSKAYFGLLSSISYPTGGRDSLIYEPNTIYEGREQLPAVSYLSASVQGTGWNGAVTQTYNLSVHSSRSVNINFSTLLAPGASTDYYHQSCVYDLSVQGGGTIISGMKIVPEQSYSTTLALSTGNYVLTMRTEGAAAIGTAEIVYQPTGTNVYANYEVGGVRLARNISRPLVGAPFQKKFIYASLAQQGRSSAYLRYKPLGEDYYANLPIHTGDDGKQCVYRVAYSNPVRPFNFYSGGHIYYFDVIEVKDDNWDNGGIAHHFTGGDGITASSVMGSNIQGPPMGNAGFAPGLETSVITFKKTGGNAGTYTTAALAETKTHYKMDTRLQKDVEGYTVRRKWTQQNVNSPKTASDFLPFDVATYTLSRQWVYVDTVTTIECDLNGANPLTTTQVILYDQTNHLQPNEVRTTMSDGRTAKVKMKYPEEMVAAGVTVPYQAMMGQNRIAPEIVKQRYVDAELLETVTTRYNSFSGNIIEPWELRYGQGQGADAGFVTMDSYDSSGKLLSQSKTNGPKTSYLYGYLGNRLVAECTNATPSEFFHQNFEDTVTDTVGVPHTGDRYHAGDYALSWTAPNGRAYTLSYWYLDGTKWKLATATYTGPITLSLGSGIDDVSIFPSDGFIKTYTYDLSASISSMIDEKGLTTYYEYDNRQRLSHVRDQNRDLVKFINYYLTGPVTEYFNTVQSQSFTKACTSGTGSSHVYTVPAGTYASQVSQADANGQALADIAANGQANANANGSCNTGNIAMAYSNYVYGGTSSITSMVVKDASGNVLYAFNNTQLNAGISIPQGTYTLVFTVAGTSWAQVAVTHAGSYLILDNNGSPSYTLTGVQLLGINGIIHLYDFF